MTKVTVSVDVEMDVDDILDDVEDDDIIAEINARGYDVSKSIPVDQQLTGDEAEYLINMLRSDNMSWEVRRLVDKLMRIRYGFDS